MSAPKELFKKYPNPVFIETGSFKGDGIQQALDAGFKIVYSIELSKNLYSNCVNRFMDNNDVHLILGDSGEMLGALMIMIKEPVTFWLDGHYSGGETALGSLNSPLLQELEAITDHNIKNHTILIYDLRGWDKNKHGFDTHDLIEKIKEINPDYKFTLEDGYDYELEIVYPNDILVAKC